MTNQTELPLFESPIPLSRRKLMVVEAHRMGYRIVNGEILNPRGVKIKGWLKHIPEMAGYIYLSYANGGRAAVHQLVAYQKFGYRWLYTDCHVRHLNNDSLDNSDDNIAIGTPLENIMDNSPAELKARSLKGAHKRRKFDSAKVREFYYSNGRSYKGTMEAFGITSKGTLHFILTRAHTPAPDSCNVFTVNVPIDVVADSKSAP